MRHLLLSSILWVMSRAMQKPDLYVWLEQNSYICKFYQSYYFHRDPSLFGSSLPHFVTADESKQFACDCGDPLVSRMACARHASEPPVCHEIPDICMREYSILFTEFNDRLSEPLTTRPITTTTTTEPPTTTTTEFTTTTGRQFVQLVVNKPENKNSTEENGNEKKESSSSPQPTKPTTADLMFSSSQNAIEFLRKKLEQLEARLMER
ncbi:hypothetical protein OESDEN_05033 [Oesophagostomum dentatum]|uniref:Uncharacterized protein n=1 Tax=Oesophagostomum dentatum TaxID=61180 RepID=A0A0B1TCM7_OESDE|nr:hypothetical protein OESDEN_05033 [Oesophagostomum dentatum]